MVTCACCRLAGQCLVVDVRRDDSVVCHSPPLRQVRAETSSRRPPITGVLGRRHLPSRGLPASATVSPAPLKRCRVNTPPRRSADFSVHCDDVTDDEDERNKENRRPDCSREHAVSVERRRRYARVVSSNRCVERRQQSPENHIYQTLEPTADCRAADDLLSSPIYATIDSDDAVDLSTHQRHQYSCRLPSVSSLTQQRHHSPASRKTNKRVTFSVSIITYNLLALPLEFYLA